MDLSVFCSAHISVEMVNSIEEFRSIVKQITSNNKKASQDSTECENQNTISEVLNYVIRLVLIKLELIMPQLQQWLK